MDVVSENSSMPTEQTPSADEDCEKWSKAQEQETMWTFGVEISLSTNMQRGLNVFFCFSGLFNLFLSRRDHKAKRCLYAQLASNANVCG